MAKSFSVLELAEQLKVRYIGDSNCKISGVNGLETASSSDASFLANPKYREAMALSKAGVICVENNTQLHEKQNYFLSENPSRTFQELIELLFSSFQTKTEFMGIHPTAVIHPTAKLGENVSVGPHSVIDAHTVIQDNTSIGPNVTIMRDVKIGKNCLLYPCSVVRERCILDNRVILQPGVVIGSCGFGYTTDATGKHTKLEQVGIVHIEDDVEIGANSTVDRARFKTTVIKKGTKIDNLVQIAHNVEIGENNIIAAQTGISGSTKTGKGVMFGGQCGSLGHLEITDHALFASRTGISKSMKNPGKFRGSPAQPIEQYNRQKAHVRKLDSYAKRLKELEALVNQLVEKSEK